MPTPLRAGPILFARAATAEHYDMALVAVLSQGAPCPIVTDADGTPVTADVLYDAYETVIYRWSLRLPASPNASYTFDGQSYPVQTDLSGDMRIAYASCNGEEDEDPDWSEEDRNHLWSRLCKEHDQQPYGLMLHGGDQIYADDILSSHPDIAAWEEADFDDKDGFIWSGEMQAAAEKHLLNRYIDLYACRDIAHMLARVPSIMMWDDHDIFDGYGSHPEPKQTSAVGMGLYAISARMFRLFQQGLGAQEPMPQGGVAFDAPCFSVIAPDLRATRTPERVMDEASWEWFDTAIAARRDGKHCFVMSSVPALGPRLSWVEFILDNVWPGINKYEDDLRDQWQSRTHRKAWRRFLGLMVREIEEHRQPVTLLSGEIHVATRAEMLMKNGGVLHQLVASGISHTPPGRGYARMLGALAAVGEDPLIGYPITIHPPCGQKHRYISQRNYLRLTRRDGKWHTNWEFEQSGSNPEMMLTGQLRLDS